MTDHILKEIEKIGGWAEELIHKTQDMQQDDAQQVYAAAEELYHIWQAILNTEQLTSDEALQAMKELRRPLNTISGFTHPHVVSQYENIPDDIQKLYQRIQSSSARLVNEMMDALGI
ncbi:MAG: hypothetical protein D6711_08885 [Chloroflexi bacterium]|nr:MAG: hypothetical protein D6711_08885 [Chloroflexota bacterium]